MLVRDKIIGLDRTLSYNWIESSVEMILKGYTPEQIWIALDPIISSSISGVDARRKCKTVIFRVWIKTPVELNKFKDEALKMFVNGSKAERLAIHWGMFLVAYPFFRDVVAIIGKMLKLQDEMENHQLVRRIIEIYGERETVIRATQRLIVSLKNWQVIDSNIYKNIISRKNIKAFKIAYEVQAWLIEGLIIAYGEKAMNISKIKKHSCLYPFFVEAESQIINLNTRLEISRHSGVDDIIWLK